MVTQNDTGQPLHPDEQIHVCTGKQWAEWRAIIDSWDGEKQKRAAIASYLMEQHQVRRVWAQAIAVYYCSQARV
jgi:hypothetical protein